MKILMILFYSSLFLFVSFAQEIPIKVIEKTGKIDVKFRDGEWQTVNADDILLSGTEIFTGIHSSLTMEFGVGSYITVNQLSKVTIENMRLKKNEANLDLNLNSGFLVILSKKQSDLNNKIIVNFMQSSIVFDNSGGEIYLRKEQGAIIKSFMGKVSINPKIKTFYFITKNEVCGITKDGLLLEYDYFLRQAINNKPNEITNENQIETYFEYLSKPYNFDSGTNDYRDSKRP